MKQNAVMKISESMRFLMRGSLRTTWRKVSPLFAKTTASAGKIGQIPARKDEVS